MGTRAAIALALAVLGLLAVDAWPGTQRGWRGMSEQERIEAYNANGYHWPPGRTTVGWPPRDGGAESALYADSRARMERMVRTIGDFKLKWDEWSGFVQSRLMPRFTPHGFKKVWLPDHIFAALNQSYYDGLATARPESVGHGPQTIPKEFLPSFIPQARLNERVMMELKPMLEEWAGVPLTAGQSYGVRVYKNGSTLVNHVDRSETHVISCIAHIAHDLDEPWPLEIEDHDGRVHAVVMEPGEMIMYESAKQFHARLTPMRGRHYGSLFIHYYPSEGWNWTMWDVHVAVPLDFIQPPSPALANAGRATQADHPA